MDSQGFKYQLQRYKGANSRFACPSCGKKRSFARYINIDGDYIGDDVGRCNSEQSCGYHKPPKDNGVVTGGFTYTPPVPTFLRNSDIYTDTFEDNLYKFLVSRFDENNVKDVCNKYIIRSSNRKWYNSTIFYQKDIKGRFRTGKMILYDNKGNRVKEPYSHIYWVHNFIKDFDFVLEQCLFGEHLLESFDSSKGSIYLVESEKTCLIASLYFENDLFLATGGLSNLNPRKLSVLKDYDAEAIPDKGCYDLWKEKLEPLGIPVNTVMEDNDQCKSGEDIADLILKYQKK